MRGSSVDSTELTARKRLAARQKGSLPPLSHYGLAEPSQFTCLSKYLYLSFYSHQKLLSFPFLSGDTGNFIQAVQPHWHFAQPPTDQYKTYLRIPMVWLFLPIDRKHHLPHISTASTIQILYWISKQLGVLGK